MDIRSAGLIASALLVVGILWLYLTEIRPTQLREECTEYMIGENELRQDNPAYESYGVFDPTYWTKMCIEAGGRDAFDRALKLGNELRSKENPPSP